MSRYLVLLAVVGVLAGCNRKPEWYDSSAPDDRMHVKASQNEVVLERKNSSEVAVTFTWEAATDLGAGIIYSYWIRLKGPGVDNTTEFTEVKGARSWSPTVKELNDILTRWGAFPGEATTVAVEVVAKTSGEARYRKPERSILSITMKAFDATNRLSAVIVGDSGERVASLGEVVAGSDRYEEILTLAPHERLRFVHNLPDEVWPAWVAADEAGKLARADDETTGAAKMIATPWPRFDFPVRGDKYKVTVDMNTHSYLIRNMGLLTAVGGATGADWEVAAAATNNVFVQSDPLSNPAIWTLTARFKDRGAGDGRAFQLQTQSEWGAGFWAPADGTDPMAGSAMVDNEGGGDNKWHLPEGADGIYTITVDVEAKSLSMKPSEVVLPQVVLTEQMLSAPFSVNYDGGGLAALVDGDPDTYWHSPYKDPRYLPKDEYGHWFEIKLPAPLGEKLIFELQKRGGWSANTAPGVAKLLASNDDGASWWSLIELDYSGIEVTGVHWQSPIIELAKPGVTNLRYCVIQTQGGLCGFDANACTSLAEFSLWGK